MLEIGIQLEVKSNIRPLFYPLFDPEYWLNIEYFLNSEAGSSYSLKFESDFIQVSNGAHFCGEVFPRKLFYQEILQYTSVHVGNYTFQNVTYSLQIFAQ